MVMAIALQDKNENLEFFMKLPNRSVSMRVSE